MCIALAAKILSLEEFNAKVDIMGVETEVNVALIEKPNVGDYILVHGGCGITKIDVKYYKELNNIFSLMLKEERNE